jgi:hypothetical protein
VLLPIIPGLLYSIHNKATGITKISVYNSKDMNSTWLIKTPNQVTAEMMLRHLITLISIKYSLWSLVVSWPLILRQFIVTKGELRLRLQ